MWPLIHYSKVGLENWPFKNFTPKELACKCCGMVYLDMKSISMLQAARDYLGEPMRVNCCHRCETHNAEVGGAPLSEHKKLALDVSTRGKDRLKVLKALKYAGFSTFGLYNTFIHTDPRKGRRWYGSKEARKLWTGLLS